MGWDNFDTEVSGGAYVKLHIGDTVQFQIAGDPDFTDKTWPDGKTSRMIVIPAYDLADTDSDEPKTLDAPVRRAGPLGELRAALKAKGIDILTRAIEIECYGIAHPTRPGARIGKWRVKDCGPAPERAVAPVADAWGDVSPAPAPAPAEAADAYNEAHEAAILQAPTVEALKRAFSAAWTEAAGDAATQRRYTEAKDVRKVDLMAQPAAPVADNLPIPF